MSMKYLFLSFFFLYVTGLHAASRLETFPAHGDGVQHETVLSELPLKKDNIGTAGLVFKAGMAMVAAVFLALGAIYMLAKLAPGLHFRKDRNAPSRIVILEAKRITPKMTLFIVEVGGKQFLVSPGGTAIVAVEQKNNPSPT